MVRNLNQLVELVATLLCLANLYGKKLKFGIHAVVYIIINLFIFVGINEYKLPLQLYFAAYLSLFLYCLLYYKESIKTTLLNCVMAAIIISLLQLIIYMLIYRFILLPNNLSENYGLLINVCCLCLMFCIRNKIKMQVLTQVLHQSNWLIICILAFVIVCLGNGLYESRKSLHLSGKDYVQIVIFTILLLFTINEWKKTQVDVERKKLQLEMNELYYAAYDELLTLVRERQHDMKNHINAIYGMIYTIDNYEDLISKQKEYCRYILDRNEETKILLTAGNPLLAGFLYKKVLEVERKGIKINYRISVESVENVIPEYDLVEIVGILVDNAREALEKRQEGIKIIRLDISCKEDTFFILVANSSQCVTENQIGEFFQPNYSSKGVGRGIGLSKLKKIVQYKKGEIIVSNEIYENINYLQFVITIPIK